MDAELNALFLATVAFVGGHFLLSSAPVRQRLVRRLGPSGFSPAYALTMTLAFVWMIVAYRAAPHVPVWQPPASLAWIPLLVMPISVFLVVAGLSTPNPTQVGGERTLAAGPAQSPAKGIISITRHPFLWGTALWSAAHLTVNGDLANITLMGGILILSVGGMIHIDRRREESLGAAWGPVKLTTSLAPFVAILSGRTKLDWRGIGWWRPLLAVVLYMALLHAHAWVLGVSPMPA